MNLWFPVIVTFHRGWLTFVPSSVFVHAIPDLCYACYGTGCPDLVADYDNQFQSRLRDLSTAEIDEIVLKTTMFYRRNANDDPKDECDADDDDDENCPTPSQEKLDEVSSSRIEAILRRDSSNNSNTIVAPLRYCRRGCMVSFVHYWMKISLIFSVMFLPPVTSKSQKPKLKKKIT